MRRFYLSFADEDDFRGAAIVDVPHESNSGAPLRRATELGCNPGGEVLAIELDALTAASVPGSHLGRLLTQDEIAHLGEIVEPGGGELVKGSAKELGEHAQRIARSRRQ